MCLDKLIENAFISFRDPTTPIQIARLKNNIAVAELFHGPTLAFKVILNGQKVFVFGSILLDDLVISRLISYLFSNT